MYSPIVEFLRIKASAHYDTAERLDAREFHATAHHERTRGEVLNRAADIALYSPDGIVAALAELGWHDELQSVMRSWHSDFITLDKQLAEQRYELVKREITRLQRSEVYESPYVQ